MTPGRIADSIMVRKATWCIGALQHLLFDRATGRYTTLRDSTNAECLCPNGRLLRSPADG